MRIFSKVPFELLTGILIAVFFLFTRFYNILILPIFTDESIYIYWAKVIATEHAHWLISITDGKPPLLVWTTAIFLSIFPSDLYLFSGRLTSVIAGGIALFGVYKLTYLLFNSKKASLIAALLYVITPFTLMYDRMALYDSLLCAMLIWTLYFALKTAETLEVKNALLWGLFLGLGFLTKPPAILFLFLTPLAVFVHMPFVYIRKNFKRLIFLTIIAIVLSEIMNNIQRFSGGYPLMELKNQQFQQPIADIINDPFRYAKGNITGLATWFIAYATPFLFIAGSISFMVLFFRKVRVGIILFVLWLVPILGFAIIGRELFPRYLVFVTPYFLIPFSYLVSLGLAKNTVFKVFTVVIFLIVISQSLKFDNLILTDPKIAPLPLEDYNQYVSQHPSGYGIDKIFAFLDSKLRTGGQVTLVTQGTFGLYPYAFKLNYWDNKNLQIIDRWPLSVIEQDIIDIGKKSNVYILFKEYEKLPEGLPVKLVLRAEKPGGKYPLLLTELIREKVK